MARKITVLSDFSNDDSLTPEQEQALEVKVDAMLDPEQPEIEPAPTLKPKKTAVKKKAPSKAKPKPKAVPVVADDGPPPLETDIVEAELADDNAGIADEEIDPSFDHDSESIEPANEPDDVKPQVAGAPPLPSDVKLSGDPKSTTELEPEPMVPIDESIDEPSDESEDDAAKKYRPPDGPLPFKRAESNTKTLEPAVSDVAAARQASNQLSSETENSLQSFKSAPTPLLAKRKTTKKRRPTAKVVLIILVLVIAAAAVPASRVVLLSLLHVRSAVKVKVVDNVTHAPLADVTVNIGGDQAVTDQSGQATITNVHLGSQILTFQKPGFVSASRTEFVDRQPATVSDVTLTANGRQYVINVVDSISQQLVSSPTAIAGTFSATGDAKGRVLLTVGTASRLQTATVSAAGYQSRSINLPADTSSPQGVQLVPNGNDFYVATGKGPANIYQVGLDGQNPKLLLTATGNETSSTALIPNNDGSQVAVVSTRDKQRDKAGYLLDALTIVQVKNKSLLTIEHAKQIKVVGWFGKRLVYTTLQADTTANDIQRYKLLSYDTVTKKSSTLATTNTFNDVLASPNNVYYAAVATDNSAQLVRIKADGTSKQVLLTKTVSTIVRSDYNNLLFMAPDGYYAATLDNTKPTAVTNTYSGPSHLYIDNPNGTQSIWIDQATAELKVHNKTNGQDRTITSSSNAAYPVRWINNTTLLYRNKTSAVDYVVSITGGSAQKVTAVGAAAGLSLWQN